MSFNFILNNKKQKAATNRYYSHFFYSRNLCCNQKRLCFVPRKCHLFISNVHCVFQLFKKTFLYTNDIQKYFNENFWMKNIVCRFNMAPYLIKIYIRWVQSTCPQKNMLKGIIGKIFIIYELGI